MHEINVEFDTSRTVERAKKLSTEHSQYYDIDNMALCVDCHYSNANNFVDKCNKTNFSLTQVIQGKRASVEAWKRQYR